MLDGPHAGYVHRLQGDQLLVGRAPECDVQLVEEGVSRRHAELTRAGDQWLLNDLHSTNGTWLNDQRVQGATALRDGDRIRIGVKALLAYELQDEHEEEMRRRMYELATRDPLTGAYNRRFFVERLSSELASAKRRSDPLSLLALDIDFFKRINDTPGLGHPAGDAVLKEFVRRLQSRLRAEDTFARVGGEEFMIIVRNDLAGAQRLAERLCAVIRDKAVDTGRGLVSVTVSIGLATVDRPDLPGATLESRADNALYKAKHAGRDRVVAYDPRAEDTAD